MIKTILVPLAGDADEATLELAHAIAKQFDAHIDVLHVRANPVQELVQMTVGDGLVTRTLWDAITDEIKRKRDKAKNSFDAFCKTKDLRAVADPKLSPTPNANWIECEGEFAREVAARARFHDLTVTTRGAFDAGELGDILVRSGRPILLASHSKKHEPVFGTVAIAWKETAESAHMISAAMPIIEEAEKVVIFVAAEDGDTNVKIGSAEKLSDHLRWHGVEPEIHCISGEAGEVGQTLVHAAQKAQAGLLLLGGYGHSRAREFVLGGVTRYALDSTDVPVFIVH
ncbi:MAG TPA: universal stress protein [Rhizomicrobium sp.]|nr:universal stress protein [Rhizomicrobium sp.]